jgi:hypothetical protein
MYPFFFPLEKPIIDSLGQLFFFFVILRSYKIFKLRYTNWPAHFSEICFFYSLN